MMIAFTILCLFFVSSLVGAIPVEQRDVFNPPITSPDANTVWRVGDKVNVTWDTTDIPPDSQITNPIGRVVLGFETSESLNLMVDSPLAQGFLLKNGQVSITVPNVPPRNNYIVVVFGDSGNTSPQFRITGGAGNATSSSAARTSTESPSVTAPIPISGTTITGGSAAGPTSTPPSTPATSSIVDVPTPASTQTTPLTTPAATSTAASSAESLAASSSSSSTDLPTGTALPADTNSATGFGMTLYYALAPLTLWALL
ncbi:Ser-Thr-rich glycosyl-phosphatidyl-inositol-anchored membrane family-domain-containing protein [Pleurotus pulmonarius]